jgi:hypothetical protein
MATSTIQSEEAVDTKRVTPDIKPSPGRGVCRSQALCPAVEGHTFNFWAWMETPAFDMAVSGAG